MEQKWWQHLWRSEEGRWGDHTGPSWLFSILPWPRDLLLLQLSLLFLQWVSLLTVSPGSAKPNTALCCVWVGSLRAWPHPVCTSPFYQTQLIVMLPTSLLFYRRLVRCLHVSLTRFCLAGKEKCPSVVSKTSQVNALLSSPTKHSHSREPQLTLVRADVKDIGGWFYRLYQSTLREGGGAVNGVFPFTEKVTSNVAVSGGWHLVAVRPSRRFYHWQ